MLVKPGIIRGNALTGIAGFLLASQGNIDWGVFFGFIAGMSLVIASACVFNNVIDRDIDKLMSRTKERAMVTKTISTKTALSIASVLGPLGLLILAIYTNGLTVLIGIIALVFYVFIYGIAKRKSVFGTIVGSIPGATPPVAGYTAVTGQLDTAAWLLFLILVFWQMPHFYAIAMYRFDDYKRAKIPVLPVVKGMYATKIQIILFIVAFTFACAVLTTSGYTSSIYLLVMLAAGSFWLYQGIAGFKAEDDKKWARKMFLISLIVLMLFSVTVSLDSVL